MMANVTASMENVAKTTLWQSNESSYLKAYRNSRVVDSTKSLLDAWNSGECFMLQSHYRERFCFRGDVISTCPSSCHNETLVKGCESDHQGLITMPHLKYGYDVVYKNRYCAACNTWKGSKSKVS